MMGIGVMASGHPLYLGMLGTHGTWAANRAIDASDLLIIIGARVGDTIQVETQAGTIEYKVLEIQRSK